VDEQLNPAERIIRRFGGQSALAALLCRRQSTVQHWAGTGRSPSQWHGALMSLARQRGIGELALSIVVQEGGSRHASSEADQRALAALAAPQVSVRFVRDVHSTHDEALAFSALARTHGWRRVAVVTSPMHTRRACGALGKAGLSVECRPAAPRDYSLRYLDSGGSRRLAFIDVLYELTATLLYRVRGWV
jgi:uncharacterized SAM-binding protein YcdF (DUF218 family)